MKKIFILLLLCFFSCGDVLEEANREEWGPDYNSITFDTIKACESKMTSSSLYYPKKGTIIVMRTSNGYYVKILLTQGIGYYGQDIIMLWTSYYSDGTYFTSGNSTIGSSVSVYGVSFDGDANDDLYWNYSFIFNYGSSSGPWLPLYVP